MKLVNGRYHYRRAVPSRIRDVIGQGEIWKRLDTGCKRTAKSKACAINAAVDRLFVMADTDPDDFRIKAIRDGLKSPYRIIDPADGDMSEMVSFVRKYTTNQRVRDILDNVISVYDAEIHNLLEQYEVNSKTQILAHAVTVQKTTDFVDYANDKVVPLINVLLEKAKSSSSSLDIMSELNALKTLLTHETQAIRADTEALRAVVPAPATPMVSASPLFSDAVKEYMKTPAVQKQKDGELRGRKNTYRFFIEVCGDRPIREYTGRDAGAFRDMLFKLPSNYGQSNGPKSIKSIRAIVKEADKNKVTDRVSSGTVKNHFARMSAMWSYFKPRDGVDKKIFSGWQWEDEAKFEYLPWTDEYLLKLIENQWPKSRSISQHDYAFIVGIGSWTGMRLEEICRLRSHDIECIDGIWCIRVQPHKGPGHEEWEPKTASGERLIPICDALLDAGLLKLSRERDGYLFDLKFSQDGKRSAKFQSDFSSFKNKLGIPAKTIVFHSFRHNVSTMLRQRPDGGNDGLREIWIDAFLGHEASHKSSGTKTYLNGIDVRNLKKVADSVHYPSWWSINRLMGRE